MTKKIILIVDDSADNIQLISGILKEQYKVKAATRGDKALTIAQKIPPPDFILLDVVMPEMDGYEVCQQLKNNSDTMNIPVVFITGNMSDEEQQKGLELGAEAYLGKPVDASKLLAIIERVLA
jgi:putative two-component system response regulator